MPMEYLMTTSCQDGEGACVNAAGGAEVQSTHAWSTAWIDAGHIRHGGMTCACGELHLEQCEDRRHLVELMRAFRLRMPLFLRGYFCGENSYSRDHSASVYLSIRCE
jgi:hypothetical protein